jgi:hypothetical protein
MNYKFATLAIATAVAVSGAVYAQQIEQFGRDSVYAVPAKSASNVTTWSGAQHYARDSVYATQLPEASAPVITNTAGLQRFGRDSVQAGLLQNGSAQQTSATIGATSTKGEGG